MKWTWQGQGEGRLVCSVEYKTGENGAAFKDRIGRNSTYSLPLSLVHSSFQCVADKGRKYGACDEGRKWLISSKMLLNFLHSGEFALIQVTSTKVVWMVERIWGFVNWLIWCKWSRFLPTFVKAPAIYKSHHQLFHNLQNYICTVCILLTYTFGTKQSPYNSPKTLEYTLTTIFQKNNTFEFVLQSKSKMFQTPINKTTYNSSPFGRGLGLNLEHNDASMLFSFVSDGFPGPGCIWSLRFPLQICGAVLFLLPGSVYFTPVSKTNCFLHPFALTSKLLWYNGNICKII